MKAKFISGKFRFKKPLVKVLSLFDRHWPFNETFDTDLKVIREEKPDIIYLGGDMLNMDQFSHWAKKVPKKAKKIPNPKKYYEAANKEFFKPIREAAGDKCIIFYQLGNHEDWAYKAINDMPEGEGYWEVENNIKYVDYFIKPRNGVKIGKLWHYHGDFDGYYKNNPVKKLITKYHRSMIFGHYHSFEVASLVVPVDEEAIVGYCIGCGTECNPNSYGKDMPSDRTQGLALEYIKQSGDFYVIPVQIKNREFYLNGKHYVSKWKPKKVEYEM